MPDRREAYFITAAGTGVGKTLVTAALAWTAYRQGRSVRAVKPVLTGFSPAETAASDTGQLAQAQGLSGVPLDLISPWRFTEPLSPDMAARREGRQIPFDALLEFSRDVLAGPESLRLIEGIGGVMVPLDDRHTVRDWIRALDIPILLVMGSYLGAISHGLTALASLTQCGLIPARIIISESSGGEVPLAETALTVANFADGVPIQTIRRRSGDAVWRDIAELSEDRACKG